MKACYCIGRVIEIREGYAQGDKPRPKIIKLSMEPNPYTPSFTAEIALAHPLGEGTEVGQRVKVTLVPATEEEWREFQEAVSEPEAIETR